MARVPDTGEPIYGNTDPEQVDDKPKPVPVNRFSEYVTRLKREKNAGFGKQYKVRPFQVIYQTRERVFL